MTGGVSSEALSVLHEARERSAFRDEVLRDLGRSRACISAMCFRCSCARQASTSSTIIRASCSDKARGCSSSSSYRSMWRSLAIPLSMPRIAADGRLARGAPGSRRPLRTRGPLNWMRASAAQMTSRSLMSVAATTMKTASHSTRIETACVASTGGAAAASFRRPNDPCR